MILPKFRKISKNSFLYFAKFRRKISFAKFRQILIRQNDFAELSRDFAKKKFVLREI